MTTKTKKATYKNTVDIIAVQLPISTTWERIDSDQARIVRDSRVASIFWYLHRIPSVSVCGLLESPICLGVPLPGPFPLYRRAPSPYIGSPSFPVTCSF